MVSLRSFFLVALLAAVLTPVPAAAQDSRRWAEAAQERRELSRVLQRIEQQLASIQHQQSDMDVRVQRLEALGLSPHGVRWRLVREERNPAYDERLARIAELEQELERERRRHSDQWPGIRELRQSINTERAGLVSIPEFIANVVGGVNDWPEGGGPGGGRGEWRQRAAELEARERQLAAMQADVDRRRAQVDNRERQLAARQRDLDRYSEQVKGLERAQRQLVSGQSELAQARQQLAQQKVAFDRIVKERGGRNQRRGSEIAKLQKDLDKVNKDNDQLRKVVADHQRQLDRLGRENAKLDKALEERTQEARKLLKEREALTRQLEGRRSNEKPGPTHPADALRRARELDQARRGYEKQIADLSTRTDQLTAQIAQLQRRGDVAGANKLRGELSGLMAQLAKARKALEDLPKR